MSVNQSCQSINYVNQSFMQTKLQKKAVDQNKAFAYLLESDVADVGAMENSMAHCNCFQMALLRRMEYYLVI